MSNFIFNSEYHAMKHCMLLMTIAEPKNFLYHISLKTSFSDNHKKNDRPKFQALGYTVWPESTWHAKKNKQHNIQKYCRNFSENRNWEFHLSSDHCIDCNKLPLVTASRNWPYVIDRALMKSVQVSRALQIIQNSYILSIH